MTELMTNFKDDILAESMEGRRRYQMITNEDGTVSFADVTEYLQVGSEFGQAEVNAIHRELNKKFDSGDVVDPLAAEETGFAADAKLTGDAIREVNVNLDEGLAQCFQSASSGKAGIRDAIIAAGGTVNNTSDTDYPSYADLITALKGIKFLVVGRAYAIFPSDSSGIAGGWSGSNPTMQNRVAFDATPFKTVTFSIYLSHGSSIYHYTEIAVSVLSDSGSVLTSTAKRITNSKDSGAYTLTLSLASINRKVFIRTQFSKDSNYNDCSGSVSSIVLST